MLKIVQSEVSQFEIIKWLYDKGVNINEKDNN
jgi:hypothetical protein